MARYVGLQFFAQVSRDNFPAEVKDYYNRTALEEALSLLVFRQYGQKETLPQNQGSTVRFRRWSELAPALTPLVEGRTPVGESLSHTDITATVEQYGSWIPITDRVKMEGIDPVLNVASKRAGNQKGKTLDLLCRNKLMGGSNFKRAGGVTNRSDVKDKISEEMIRKMVRTLKSMDAPMVTESVLPTVKYGTKAIPPSYIAIIHPNSAYDIKQLSHFVRAVDYADGSTVMKGEIGAIDEVRFVETTHGMCWPGAGASGGTNVQETGGKADVYGLVMFGADAYGEVPLSGMSGRVIIKAKRPDDTVDTSDPMNQRSTVAWVAIWTAKILDDTRIIRGEYAVSD